MTLLFRPIFYIASFFACAVVALSTGCASGGFKLTRQYARWVNSQQIILRIVIYLLTGIVFAVTLLIDAIIFNTMDFWNGTVAAGTYNFSKDDKNFVVKHELQPGTQLKRSFIEVRDSKQSLLQTVELKETLSSEIEMFVDGKLRSKVRDIASFPVASIFDQSGRLVEEQGVLTSMPLSTAVVAAQH